MKFNTPRVAGVTNLPFTPAQLNSCPNGLFRATFHEAVTLMPELEGLFDKAWDMLVREGHWPADFEIDVKVHMLMPGQYPCIPNWHCDNVPRDENGSCQYRKAEECVINNEPPMYLWVSGTPCTRFLARPINTGNGHTPASHAELASFIQRLDSEPHSNNVVTTLIMPQTFYSMDRLTPHQGTASAEHCWRVFLRLTHKHCLPDRPKTTVLRRHSQVYLDSATFGW